MAGNDRPGPRAADPNWLAMAESAKTDDSTIELGFGFRTDELTQLKRDISSLLRDNAWLAESRTYRGHGGQKRKRDDLEFFKKHLPAINVPGIDENWQLKVVFQLLNRMKTNSTKRRQGKAEPQNGLQSHPSVDPPRSSYLSHPGQPPDAAPKREPTQERSEARHTSFFGDLTHRFSQSPAPELKPEEQDIPAPSNSLRKYHGWFNTPVPSIETGGSLRLIAAGCINGTLVDRAQSEIEASVIADAGDESLQLLEREMGALLENAVGPCPESPNYVQMWHRVEDGLELTLHSHTAVKKMLKTINPCVVGTWGVRIAKREYPSDHQRSASQQPMGKKLTCAGNSTTASSRGTSKREHSPDNQDSLEQQRPAKQPYVGKPPTAPNSSTSKREHSPDNQNSLEQPTHKEDSTSRILQNRDQLQSIKAVLDGDGGANNNRLILPFPYSSSSTSGQERPTGFGIQFLDQLDLHSVNAVRKTGRTPPLDPTKSETDDVEFLGQASVTRPKILQKEDNHHTTVFEGRDQQNPVAGSPKEAVASNSEPMQTDHDEEVIPVLPEEEVDPETEQERMYQEMIQNLLNGHDPNGQTVEQSSARITKEVADMVKKLFPFIRLEQFLVASSKIEFPPVYEFAIGLSPHQVAGVACIVVQNGTLGTGVYADRMGLGKTITSLGAARVYSLVSASAADISENPSNHLGPDAPKGSVCPSHNKFGVYCPCHPDSNELYGDDRLHARMGAQLILATPGAMESYKGDVAKLFRSDVPRSPTSVRVALQYPFTPKIQGAIGGLLEASEHSEYFRVPDWTELEDEEREITHRKDTVAAIKSRKKMDLSGSYRTVRVPYLEDDVRDDAQRFDGSRRRSAFLILITSRGSFKGRVKDSIGCKRHRQWVGEWDDYQPGQERYADWDTVTSQWFDAATFSSVWIDECHIDYGSEANSNYQDLKTVCEAYDVAYSDDDCMRLPFVWGASGTPDCSKPLQAILLVASLADRPDWTEDDVLQPLSNEKERSRVNQIVESLKNQARTGLAAITDREEFRQTQRLYSRLVPRMQIRRTNNTLWYDRSPVAQKGSTTALQVHRCYPDDDRVSHRLVELEKALRRVSDERYAEAIEQWQEKGGDPREKPARSANVRINETHIARIECNIPHFERRWKEMHGGEIPEGMSATESGDPEHIGKLASPTQSGPASVDFARFVLNNQSDNCKWQKTTEICDEVRQKNSSSMPTYKVVIFVNTPLVRMAWCHLLSARYGRKSVALGMPGISKPQRDKALEAFCSTSTEEGGGPWILLTCFASYGTGSNLQRANVTILVEPMPNWDHVSQAMFRTDRYGQKERVCYFHILVNEHSAVDRQIIRCMEIKREQDKGYLESAADGGENVATK